MSRTNVLGVEFDNVTMQEAVERALGRQRFLLGQCLGALEQAML